MATLVVFTFENETGAEQMRDRLVGLQPLQLIRLADAAVVVRRQDGKVKIKQAASLVGAGALGGAFWDMFIGLMFVAPWLGVAIEAAADTPGSAFSETGVDKEFIKEVAGKIEPGHSALFLLVQSWTEDRVMHEIKGLNPEVLQTSISRGDEANLKSAFGAYA